ncbi:hypothetical protein [Tenacibaculum caenipelagi]|uniref:hypothetical protein n=1 Tax=Tenacibaculum caenipelagi TaxID=1325435 RepID=UPI00105B4497|nr:hypothetical protein [Tenacibaculum caenipelagi]
MSDEGLSENELKDIWNQLYEKYSELSEEPGNNQLNIKKKLEYLISKYKAVVIAIDCLKSGYDNDLVSFLKSEGYVVSKDNYDEDLETIKEEANDLLVRANTFSSQLPKETKEKFNIYDILSSYSIILGYDLDHESVSVFKFLSLKKQVKNKIKLLESNNG